MTNEERAYLAGIIDGEGSIGIKRSFVPDAQISEQYTPRVRITNTNEALFDWIAARMAIAQRYAHRRRPNHKQAASLVWVGTKAMAVIELVHPWLVTKREQAELLRELATQLGGAQGRPVPAANYEARRRAYERLRLINQRGTGRDEPAIIVPQRQRRVRVLTREDVIEIRRARSAGEKASALARRFGVSRQRIYVITAEAPVNKKPASLAG